MLSCGLDFGTSNSTLGISENGVLKLIPLEKDSLTLKSAIFFDFENKITLFGNNGFNTYLSGNPGRLMLALKSILGSVLVKDTTIVDGKLINYQDIIGLLVKHIKTTVEQNIAQELTNVVIGRPVRYNDDSDKKDQLAEHTMREIASAQGFKNIEFAYEPIAAALDYETTITKEELALIVDIGGGTSDFTLIKLKPNNKSVDRADDILANAGVHIGGTDFDRELSLHTIMPLLGKNSLMGTMNGSLLEIPSSIYYDLTTWHMLSFIYSPKTLNNIKEIYAMAKSKNLLDRLLKVVQRQLGHHLLNLAETSKIKLTAEYEVGLDLSRIEDNLDASITRIMFEEYTKNLIDQLTTTINQLLTTANTVPNKINTIFLTGGTTQLPVIKKLIQTLFPKSLIISGDIFGSVGKGLTISASRMWG